MPSFTLSIDLGNDAMQTAGDVANALVEVAADLRGRGFVQHAQSIRDNNGNRVGQHKLRDEPLPTGGRAKVGRA